MSSGGGGGVVVFFFWGGGGWGEGPDNVFFSFLVINVFYRGSYEPPSRSNWVQLLFEGGPYQYL